LVRYSARTGFAVAEGRVCVLGCDEGWRARSHNLDKWGPQGGVVHVMVPGVDPGGCHLSEAHSYIHDPCVDSDQLPKEFIRCLIE
jgi:hypothetical protein